jgi:hypothetical protein
LAPEPDLATVRPRIASHAGSCSLRPDGFRLHQEWLGYLQPVSWLVVSPESLQSRWVGKELSHAIAVQRQRVPDAYPLIPLLLAHQ